MVIECKACTIKGEIKVQKYLQKNAKLCAKGGKGEQQNTNQNQHKVHLYPRIFGDAELDRPQWFQISTSDSEIPAQNRKLDA